MRECIAMQAPDVLRGNEGNDSDVIIRIIKTR